MQKGHIVPAAGMESNRDRYVMDFSLLKRWGYGLNPDRQTANQPKLVRRKVSKVTPWTIRYVIRYFSFNMLRRRPAMHVEGLNMHALDGAIHIARSIPFVAVAAICIDKPKSF